MGLFDSIGNRSNNGCRLTVSEIQDRVTHLQESAHFFGANIRFTWPDGQPTQVQDAFLFAQRREDPVTFDFNVVFSNWQTGHINVYFTGFVEGLGGAPALASTVDPSQTGSWLSGHPWISLNDGGFERPSGFQTGFNPVQMTSYNVFEHEMTHYLARFANRTFGQAPHQRSYSSSEHLSDGSNNILELLTPARLKKLSAYDRYLLV